MKNVVITSKNWSVRSNQENISQTLALIAISLMGMGLALVYSASFIFAAQKYGEGLFFFKRQLFFVSLSIVAMFAVSRIPYQFYKKYFWYIMGVSIFLLALVMIPGLGHRAGGATRWLKVGMGFRIEPAEFIKLSVVLLFAYFISNANQSLKTPAKYWMPLIGTLLLIVAMLLKQPDFGTSVIIVLTGLTMLFCFGINLKRLVMIGLLILPALVYFVMSEKYRMQRLLIFLDPWRDPSNGGFQMIQSMVAFHSGGLTGAGLGKGQAKLFFLPEAHTDFILSVMGEETGFVGMCFLFLVFGFLIFKGFQIAGRCQDLFGKSLAAGMASLLCIQALVNAGVVTGLLPTKGLTMPFLSYGGSSLLAAGIACGILISVHTNQEQKWQR